MLMTRVPQVLCRVNDVTLYHRRGLCLYDELNSRGHFFPKVRLGLTSIIDYLLSTTRSNKFFIIEGGVLFEIHVYLSRAYEICVQQGCILVGCVPPASMAISTGRGGCVRGMSRGCVQEGGFRIVCVWGRGVHPPDPEEDTPRTQRQTPLEPEANIPSPFPVNRMTDR